MADQKSLHIAMYPWFDMGHITSFLLLSNKLAQRGHKISFLLPPKIQHQLQLHSLHPDLITFIPVPIPRVDGLPEGAETTLDVPASLMGHLMTAMDSTQSSIEQALSELKPQFIFYDMVHWLPSLAHKVGVKAISYCTYSSVTVSYLSGKRVSEEGGKHSTWADLLQPPLDFPSASIRVRAHEARKCVASRYSPFGSGVLFHDRLTASFCNPDALCFRAFREIDGPYCDYAQKLFGKPVILAGPLLPEPPIDEMSEQVDHWLRKFDAGTVIYCACSREFVLNRDQFMELVLGLEQTGRPFFVAPETPMNGEEIESAFPEGFAARTEGRGMVHGGGVNEQLMLKHPSVGCFVTHGGLASLVEGLLSDCRLVLLPQSGDQFINARMIDGELRVGVEIKKGEEDGLFTKEAVCKAVMEADSEVRANHRKWRELLLRDELENSCIDSFVHDLQSLLV
ncbi:hypothetical protein Ancab_033898 [Ancistrocladus abbreviatus]